MKKLFLGAAAAALICVCGTPTASADIVILRDGKVLPAKVADQVKPGEIPGNDALKASGRSNLDLAYDAVKLKGKTISPATVAEIYCTNSYTRNEYFNNAETNASSGYWSEAAENYRLASEDLKDADKQVALYKRMLCLVNLGDVDGTFAAAQELMSAFPKTYYFADVQNRRARIFLIKGKAADAKSALDAVVKAPGMNNRDYFEAKVTTVYLFDYKTARNDMAKYKAAEDKYRAILKEIQTRPGAASEAHIQKLKCMVGIAKCLNVQGKYDEARRYLAQVIDDKGSLADRQLLAQAYNGMGDVVYKLTNNEINEASKSGRDISDATKKEWIEKLTDAALHYLRVAVFYTGDAGDELQGAKQNLAQVWKTQFELMGEEDVRLAKRAINMFVQAHRMMPRGEAKRALRREVMAFMNSVKEIEAAQATTEEKKDR